MHRRLWIVLALAAYVASFALWSRVFPAPRRQPLDGRRVYGFVARDPDWESTLRRFYWPLIRLDEAAGGPVHAFDVRYL